MLRERGREDLRYPVYSLQALTLLKQPLFRTDIANPALAQEMMLDMVQSFLPADRAAAGPRAADLVTTPLGHSSSSSSTSYSNNNKPNDAPQQVQPDSSVSFF